uniref:Interferon lambda receptor 1 n=1 Tax=Sphenodon punctatus TaxID=8508 RepID=A0A8D0H9R7_SPHPU
MFFWLVGVLIACVFLCPPCVQILGKARLPPPRNVTLASKDFDVVLSWLPGNGYPRDVVYKVSYWSFVSSFRKIVQRRWKNVPHCTNISKTTCNLTCVPVDLHNKYRARVRAHVAGDQSEWVESGDVEYYYDLELAPPVLEVRKMENTLLVNATFPYASCVERGFIDLKYDLEFWNAGTEKKESFKDILKNTEKKINISMSNGNYCLSARASFQRIQLKHSEFSKPFCMVLNQKVNTELPIAIATPLLVLIIFVTGFFSFIGLYLRGARRAKLPQALDFSSYRAPISVLENYPGKEFFTEDIFCTEQPITRGRRNQPSVHSLSGEDEEEEDDSDSSATYAKRPQFPKRGPSSSMNQQVSDSESGGSWPGGECLPDLTGLGLSHFVWRGKAAEEGTSDFQGSEVSLSQSSSSGSSSLSEVRYLATRGHEHQDMDVDIDQKETYLQVSLLKEQLDFQPPIEHSLPTKGLPYTNHLRQQSPQMACLLIPASQNFHGLSIDRQLVCFETLKLEDNESTASDPDDDRDPLCKPEERLPLSPAIRGTSKKGTQWGLEEEKDKTLKFKECQWMGYMSRN